MSEQKVPAVTGRVLSERLGVWSVWIEGGGMPGRWMSDHNDNKPVWRGPRMEAECAASERQRVHGPRGLRYEVRPAPSDTEAYYGHLSVLMAAMQDA